jgi:hypothetical protein
MKVDTNALHLFRDLAQVFIEQNDGDAEKALAIALAYCSGHHKDQLVCKSMITGQENVVTVEMTANRGYLA